MAASADVDATSTVKSVVIQSSLSKPEDAMTRGERIVSKMRLKERFYDAHERRAYLRSVEIAKRILDEPSLIAKGRGYLDRFVRDDPSQAVVFQLWQRALAWPPEEMVRQFLADSDQGSALRDSAPVFVVLPKADALRLWTSDA